MADKFRKMRGKNGFLKIAFIIVSIPTFILSFLLFIMFVVTVLSLLFIGLAIVWLGLIYWLVGLFKIIFPIFVPFLIIYSIFFLYPLYVVYREENPKFRWLFLALSAIGVDWLMLFICGRSKSKEQISRVNNAFSAEQQETQIIKVTYIEEDI